MKNLNYKYGFALVCFYHASIGGHGAAEVSMSLYDCLPRPNKKLFEIKKYELFDLEPALGLANRYIQDARLNLLLGNHTAPTKLPNKSDLLISNYAFSELVRNLQDQYLTDIIQNSPRGYVIYNHISPPEFRSLTAKEFASKIPGAEIFREIPTTHSENVLVVWGHRKLLDEKRFVRI